MAKTHDDRTVEVLKVFKRWKLSQDDLESFAGYDDISSNTLSNRQPSLYDVNDKHTPHKNTYGYCRSRQISSSVIMLISSYLLPHRFADIDGTLGRWFLLRIQS